MNAPKHVAPNAATNLRLDWCGHDAALYAVTRWHYSRSLPAGKLLKVGVWEDDRFIGCVIFSRGANPDIGSPYGLTQLQVCELTRVALDAHKSATSRIVRIALKMLSKQCPGLRLVVSYADSNQGHHGGIYQASGWTYVGECASEQGVLVKGVKTHRRSLNSRYGTSNMDWLRQNVDPEAKVLMGLPKHKYLYPLHKTMAGQIGSLAKPYPKRVKAGLDSVPPKPVGGAAPTHALQTL